MPGTGKTATVMSCIASLRAKTRSGDLPFFNFIDINCLKLKSPMDAYTVLWRNISGYHCSNKVALRKLGDFFQERQEQVVSSSQQHDGRGKKKDSADTRDVIVCLVDELGIYYSL